VPSWLRLRLISVRACRPPSTSPPSSD
jgi:hypothetical protein